MDDPHFSDNTHRSLRELVSIDAWFVQDNEYPNRLTLHADVSFRDERISGGSDVEVIFQIAVKRCDIVFCPPRGPTFRVDPSSVAKPKPLNPKTVEYKSTKKASGGLGGTLGISPKGFSSKVNVRAEASRSHESVEQGATTTSYYNELWSKTREGFHAWSVDGRDLENERLLGPVISGREAPRLTLIDSRSEEARRMDAERRLDPVSSIYVRCRREDLDVYNVRFKDEERQSWFVASKGKKEKEVAAREVIKLALFEEGLSAGDIVNDPYAEMRICDVAIPIID